MLKSKYVYSQRTFNSKDDADTIEQVKKNVTKSVKKWTIPSQVWLGYLDKSNDWSVKDSTGALAVDIGTGKMAFGYAEKVQQVRTCRLSLLPAFSPPPPPCSVCGGGVLVVSSG